MSSNNKSLFIAHTSWLLKVSRGYFAQYLAHCTQYGIRLNGKPLFPILPVSESKEKNTMQEAILSVLTKE